MNTSPSLVSTNLYQCHLASNQLYNQYLIKFFTVRALKPWMLRLFSCLFGIIQSWSSFVTRLVHLFLFVAIPVGDQDHGWKKAKCISGINHYRHPWNLNDFRPSLKTEDFIQEDHWLTWNQRIWTCFSPLLISCCSQKDVYWKPSWRTSTENRNCSSAQPPWAKMTEYDSMWKRRWTIGGCNSAAAVISGRNQFWVWSDRDPFKSKLWNFSKSIGTKSFRKSQATGIASWKCQKSHSR